MNQMVPLPAIYYEDFIALNQKDRVDNIIEGESKWAHFEKVCQDIRNFKA